MGIKDEDFYRDLGSAGRTYIKDGKEHHTYIPFTTEDECIDPSDVNKSHYQSIKTQPIELIQSYDMPFELDNVLKYVMREKGQNVSDINKAIDYCKMFLNRAGRRVTYDGFIRENDITGNKRNVIKALEAFNKTKEPAVIELLITILGIMLEEEKDKLEVH